MPVFEHFKIFERKSKPRLALIIEGIQQTSWFHVHPNKVFQTVWYVAEQIKVTFAHSSAIELENTLVVSFIVFSVSGGSRVTFYMFSLA